MDEAAISVVIFQVAFLAAIAGGLTLLTFRAQSIEARLAFGIFATLFWVGVFLVVYGAIT